MKIAITLEDGRFSPPSTMSELGTLLTHVGGQALSKGGPGLEGASSLGTAFGPATITVEAPETGAADSLRETDKGAPPETRRDRLARLLRWTFLPGATGQGSIHVRLDAMMPGRGFMTDQEFHLRSELSPERFWVSVHCLRERILDRAEALADALS